MKPNKRTFLIVTCITFFIAVAITLGILYGLQWMPKGSSFSLDTLAVFLGAGGSVGAIFIILHTTQKQIKEQQEMQKQNVKLNLYDKRYQIYTKVVDFINGAVSCSSFSITDVNDFHEVNREAYMLFQSNITDYLEKLRVKGNRLALFVQNDVPGSLGEIKHFDERQELLKWFTEQQAAVVEIFDRYINVNKLGL